jgi:hypothetical protein
VFQAVPGISLPEALQRAFALNSAKAAGQVVEDVAMSLVSGEIDKEHIPLMRVAGNVPTTDDMLGAPPAPPVNTTGYTGPGPWRIDLDGLARALAATEGTRYKAPADKEELLARTLFVGNIPIGLSCDQLSGLLTAAMRERGLAQVLYSPQNLPRICLVLTSISSHFSFAS